MLGLEYEGHHSVWPCFIPLRQRFPSWCAVITKTCSGLLFISCRLECCYCAADKKALFRDFHTLVFEKESETFLVKKEKPRNKQVSNGDEQVNIFKIKMHSKLFESSCTKVAYNHVLTLPVWLLARPFTSWLPKKASQAQLLFHCRHLLADRSSLCGSCWPLLACRSHSRSSSPPSSPTLWPPSFLIISNHSSTAGSLSSYFLLLLHTHTGKRLRRRRRLGRREVVLCHLLDHVVPVFGVHPYLRRHAIQLTLVG